MAAVPSHRSPAFTSDLPSLFTDSPLHRWGQISLVPLSAWPTVRTQLEVPDSPTAFVTPWAGTLWEESSPIPCTNLSPEVQKAPRGPFL